MCHGAVDGTASIHLLQESVNLLRGHHGGNVTAHAIPGLGHAHSPAEAALLRDFLLLTLARSDDDEAGAAAAAEAGAPLPEAPAKSKSVIKMRGRAAPPPAADAGRELAGSGAGSAAATSHETRHEASCETSMGDGVTISRQTAADDPTQEELVVVVDLPEVETMSQLELSLSPGRFELVVPGRDAPMLITLEEGWDSESARAKFSKRRRELTVRLARNADEPRST